MKQDIRESRDDARLQQLTRIGDAMRFNQIASNRFDDVVGAFMGLNRTDGHCLDIIDRHGRLSAGQLANESGLTTGAVTAVIDRLERAGYARRVRDLVDRRKIWVETTEATKRLVGAIFGFYETIGPHMMSRFSSEQLAGILEFLEIGSFVQGEMAGGLRDHIPDASATLEERVERAQLFRRAMEASVEKLSDEIKAVPATKRR